MGCGESKHVVATENTIIRKKSNSARNSKSKDIKTVDETNQSVTGGNAAEVKEITENKELKEEEEETGRLISKESPNQFSSSRKDEDVDESSASEAKSEFFSPRIESSKENYFNESVNKLDDYVEQNKEEEGEKLVQEKENEEKTATLKEVEMDKQAKAADTSNNIGAEVVASPAIEQMEQKEALAISASKDIKAD